MDTGGRATQEAVAEGLNIRYRPLGHSNISLEIVMRINYIVIHV
jgi:hypothetical protein